MYVKKETVHHGVLMAPMGVHMAYTWRTYGTHPNNIWRHEVEARCFPTVVHIP